MRPKPFEERLNCALSEKVGVPNARQLEPERFLASASSTSAAMPVC
jgi:hypothetical protein